MALSLENKFMSYSVGVGISIGPKELITVVKKWGGAGGLVVKILPHLVA